MWEKPKRTEAVHQPARSLLLERESKFCRRPRKRNSSGHAVKKKMATETNGSERQACHCGANWMKCMLVPRGMAMAPKTRKLARTKKLQRLPSRCCSRCRGFCG